MSGLWNIPSLKGKLERVMTQFRPTESLKPLLLIVTLITFVFMAELGSFYLKYILWIPSQNYLVLGRMVLIWLIGIVVMRETFEFLDNPYILNY